MKTVSFMDVDETEKDLIICFGFRRRAYPN
jgi:hypothetical protein